MSKTLLYLSILSIQFIIAATFEGRIVDSNSKKNDLDQMEKQLNKSSFKNSNPNE